MKPLIQAAAAAKDFYPTPEKVADMLLAKIDFKKITTILEPSAGTGNLVWAVLNQLRLRGWQNRIGKEIHCIEKEPNLRAILKYRFCGTYEDELLRNESRNTQQEREYDSLRCADIFIAHDDFLAFNTDFHYDLIVMNPPFSEGDAHLMKAIALQEKYGGMIRCILNAETLRNPYTNRRKQLCRKLAELNADVEYVQNAFSASERPTDVEIAIIKIDIPEVIEDNEIFERLRKAEAYADVDIDSAATDMTVNGLIEKSISYYKAECEAGVRFIQDYKALRPYINHSLESVSSAPIIFLKIGKLEDPQNMVNVYLKEVRLKYWSALFHNPQFIGHLPSNLQEEYLKKVATLGDYEYSMYNIEQLAAEMNSKLRLSIEQTIIKKFDEMTQEHSWYPECAKTIHYFDGWKTNKAHKIGKKVILPLDAFYHWGFRETEFDVHHIVQRLGDIEKCFDFFAGDMSAPIELADALKKAEATNTTKNIECKFFTVSFYKKGTTHLTFKDPALVERFNIYCCAHKNWLPPSYGHVSYADMSQEEKNVVDGFHGNGKCGSGESAYANVLANKNYYLASPIAADTLRLAGG